MQHVVKLCDLPVLIPDNGEVDRVALGLLDIAGPGFVILHRIHRNGDHLALAFGEFVLQPGGLAQFGGAYRREIGRVGEQYGPPVADPVVEVDPAFSGIGLEVGGGIA